MKKTVVLGATPNPTRYAYRAVRKLRANNHEVVPVGIRSGEIDGVPIRTDLPQVDQVDTVTLYVGPQNQEPYYKYILGLRPKRIIFNPGTENPELMKLAAAQNIETITGCTLIMLSIGNY